MKKILALLLAMMMVLALCACGEKEETTPAVEDVAAVEEVPAAEDVAAVEDAADTEPAPAAAEAPAAPEGDASGEPTGEPTGEPVAELFPADGYSKDLEGYKAYAADALKQDEHAPADIVETTVAAIEAAADGNDNTFAMLVNQGLILSYDEFVG